MFGKKKPEGKFDPLDYYFVLYNEKDEVIKKVAADKVPMTEEYIKQKCIEKLNDPEPCIINKTFAMTHAGYDLIEKAFGIYGHDKVNVSDLDTEIAKCFNLPVDVLSMQIKRF